MDLSFGVLAPSLVGAVFRHETRVVIGRVQMSSIENDEENGTTDPLQMGHNRSSIFRGFDR